MNLRSQSAPIQVMLMTGVRDSNSTVPVVFSVPPTDEICPMPTPLSTPADLQRFPLSISMSSSSNTTSTNSSYCSQDFLRSDQQMVLPEHDDVLTTSSTALVSQMGEGNNFYVFVCGKIDLLQQKNVSSCTLRYIQESLFQTI